MRGIVAVLAGLVVFTLGVGSPASGTDLDSAPWCPIGIHWDGEPLPIGCQTGLLPSEGLIATDARSSNPGVIEVRLDRANNRVQLLTTGYGTAEICFGHEPIKVPIPDSKKFVEITEFCTDYSVSPELAKNCMATELNAGGYEVANMHIHVGCESSFGNYPGGPPVTRAWSSDPSILQVWVEGGMGKYRALTPGKATYCWAGVVNSPQGVGDPDYPVCFTEKIHPITVNVAPLRRSEVDPPCLFDETNAQTTIHTGCSMVLDRYAGYPITSTNPDVVYPTQYGRLITSRPGESRVCFAGAPDGHCIDFTVLDPNLEIPAPATDDEASEASSEEK